MVSSCPIRSPDSPKWGQSILVFKKTQQVMMDSIDRNDIFGFIRPSVDAHTLGISAISKLLTDCGYKVEIGNSRIANAVAEISKINNVSLLKSWISVNRITRLGFSYRLDPTNAQMNFGKVYTLLKENNFFHQHGGPIKSVYFAGLPEACVRIDREYRGEVKVFIGDETPVESLKKIGVPESRIPGEIAGSSEYDRTRLEFAKRIISEGNYLNRKPIDRSGYVGFGTKQDKVVNRIQYARNKGQLPLVRVHVGPYRPDYFEALREFKSWLKILSSSGFLDIVSIGSSQLSQSDFGKDWGNRPNGGGVPINSEIDLNEIWEASRPMLVRTYAGTRNIPQLAQIYEETINIAWHALSFWWFCEIDGRGPHTVKYNLHEHIEALKVISLSGKPFEPNIPHHFSFRGADDYTYVLSGYLAAKTAKKYGIRHLILQTMLNTPKYTWGIQDLAKARALLSLVKNLEDSNFKVYLQPRAGLDYFSPDIERAKVQLATVTAMMDDIDPLNQHSPDIIHVVSYSEALHLATPEIIDDSIRITLQALEDYRKLKVQGKIDSMAYHRETQERTEDILREIRKIESLIELNYPNPYSPEGLYEIFRDGIMPVPYLWEGCEEFKNAVKWNTSLVRGAIKVIDKDGKPIGPSDRVAGIIRGKSVGRIKELL